MALIGTLLMKLRADSTQFDKSVVNSQNKIKSLSSTMTRMGTVMTGAVTVPLLMLGKNMLESAMNAVESENLFAVSMKNMQDSAREWSETLGESLGLNPYGLREDVAILNTMTRSMGLSEQQAFSVSKTITELSHDMASFYNITQDDALLKLRAGLTGEAEPLKRLGILVTENTIKQVAYASGLASVGEELTEQQKLHARFVAIMAQTTDAQGDLARTIDSPLNKLRRLNEALQLLKIELGMELIPIFSHFADELLPIMKRFNGMNDSTKDLIIKIGLFAAAIGPFLLILPGLVKLFTLISGAISGISVPVLLVIGFFALLTAGLINLYKENEKFRDLIDGIWEDIKITFDTTIGNIVDWINNRAKPALSSWYEDSVKPKLDLIIDKFGILWDKVKEFLDKIGIKIGDTSAKNDGLISAFELVLEAATALSDFFLDAFLTSLDGVILGLDAVVKLLNGDFAGAWVSIKDAIITQINFVLPAIEWMINAIIDGYNWLVRQINSLQIEVPQWVRDMLGIDLQTIGFNLKEIDRIKIDQIEISPESRNILSGKTQSRQDTLTDIYMGTMQGQMMQQQANINVNVTLDGQKISEAVDVRLGQNYYAGAR